MSLNNDNNKTGYDITDEYVTVYLDGCVHTTPSNAHNYHQMVAAVLAQDWDAIRNQIDLKHSIAKISEGDVRLEGNTVSYKGDTVNNAAVSKLLHLLNIGLSDAKPWLKFIDSLMLNPSMNSREQLYKFLEHEHMPLHADGCSIGYKGVGKDYYSISSGNPDHILEGVVDAQGRIRNQVGDKIRMKRGMVDDNLNNGCSAGLHIGSHNYADSWGGSEGHLMTVKFKPEDAVSVPECSSYQKLRVCAYEVIAENTDRRKLDDGLYEHPEEDRGCDIMTYLHNKWNKGKSPTLAKAQRKFPNLSVMELEEVLDDHECEGGIYWNDKTNNMEIKPY
jgi:hypothetical protein